MFHSRDFALAIDDTAFEVIEIKCEGVVICFLQLPTLRLGVNTELT